jgi:hypothetical protein
MQGVKENLQMIVLKNFRIHLRKDLFHHLQAVHLQAVHLQAVHLQVQ